MGRKPNALIAEFFERGQKLGDASNRYQHTCKVCGEKFPKGRIDSLTNHIAKVCPSLSEADRQKAHHFLNERTQATGASYLLALELPQPEYSEEQQDEQEQVQAAVGAANNVTIDVSALEALAEVSRQQLDPSEHDVSAEYNSRKRKRPSTDTQAPQVQVVGHGQMPLHTSQQLLPQSLMQQPQPHTMPELLLQDPQLQGLGLPGTVADNDRAELEPVLLSIDQFVAEQHRNTSDYSSHEPVADTINEAVARLIPDQLALAASAATEIIPNSQDGEEILRGLAQAAETSFYGYGTITNASTLLDPQLHPNGNQLQQEQHGHEMQPEMPVSQHLPPRQYSTSGGNNITPAEFLHDFRLNGDPHKAKTRGRFTPHRRREVQEVRRQGACIRCRMLKKPCSGGSPCSTCQHVESARLWKSPCMRARIADEFDLYSASPHYIAAFHEINKVKPKVIFERAQYMLEASHFQDSTVTPIILPSIRSVNAILANEATLLSSPDQNPSFAKIELLNQDNDTIPGIIDQYIRRSSRRLFEQETSPLMRPTLALASQLVQQKSEPLLNIALELWTATQMLFNPSLPWYISSVTTKTGENGVAQRVLEEIATTSPLSHYLVTLQLKAQLEKRCSNLAKSLMNDLERRLLQRGSSPSHFETFLTTVILLNCVEKMCYLFYTWHARATSTEPIFNLTTPSMITLPSTWPLDKSASYYTAKGSLVADVVTMLLRMRSIPPKTVVCADGVLHFDARAGGKGGGGGGGGGSAGGSGSGQEGQGRDEERTAVIAAWFASLGLRAQEVRGVSDGGRLGVGVGGEDGWKGWEGRFVGRLLLGDV